MAARAVVCAAGRARLGGLGGLEGCSLDNKVAEGSALMCAFVYVCACVCMCVVKRGA